MGEERNELSRVELGALSATICAGASGISVFFADRHSGWERLLAISFISLAVATFLIAMWTAAKTLLVASRSGREPGRSNAARTTSERPVPENAVSESLAKQPGPQAVRREPDTPAPADSTATAAKEHAQPREVTRLLRLGKWATRLLRRVLLALVTRIIPVAAAIFVFFTAVAEISAQLQSPSKQLSATLEAPYNAAVTAIAISPRGKTLAAVACNGDCADGRGADQVDVWNLTTRVMHTIFVYPRLHAFSNSEFSLNGLTPVLAYSPDGKTLATSTTGSPVTYLLTTSASGINETSLRNPHGAQIQNIAFSQDGEALITDGGPLSGNAYLWDTATGRVRAVFTDHNKYASFTDMTVSANGRVLFIADDENHAYLWNVMKDTTTALGLDANVVSDIAETALDPRGDTLAAVGYGLTSAIDLINTATGQIRSVLKDSETGAVDALAFSPDGRFLAGSGFDGTFLWNVASGRRVGPLTAPIRFPNLSPPSMNDLAFSPDGKLLATLGDDGKIYIWKISELYS